MVRMCWMQGNGVIKVEPSAAIALGSTFMRFILSITQYGEHHQR